MSRQRPSNRRRRGPHRDIFGRDWDCPYSSPLPHVEEPTPRPAPPPAPPRPRNLAPLDRGVRLVRHLNTRYDEDPALPFKVDIVLRPPEFMVVAFIGIYGGSEDIIAQAVDLASLCAFVVRNELATHPRFRRLTATGPDGFKVEFTDTDIRRRRGW